jgi:S1-C subfamily serine protease
VELRSLPARRADAGGGALVASVDPDGIAAGRLAPGDVVVEVERWPVRDAAEARERIGAARGPLLLRVRHKGSLIYVALPARR